MLRFSDHHLSRVEQGHCHVALFEAEFAHRIRRDDCGNSLSLSHRQHYLGNESLDGDLDHGTGQFVASVKAQTTALDKQVREKFA